MKGLCLLGFFARVVKRESGRDSSGSGSGGRNMHTAMQPQKPNQKRGLHSLRFGDGTLSPICLTFSLLLMARVYHCVSVSVIGTFCVAWCTRSPSPCLSSAIPVVL